MADDRDVTATSTRPRIPAAAMSAAATRLFGTVVLDVADLTIVPAIYLPRADEFATIDGADLGADDGSLIPLIVPGTAGDLIAEHGSAAAAARVLTAELRTVGAL